MKKQLSITLILLLATFPIFAQSTALETSLKQYLKTKKADIGIAVCLIETNEITTVNGGKHYPMQSVYKFPLAIAVLDAVDKKTIALNQKVHVSKTELRPGTWSPLREKYPEGNIDITIAELLEYSVSKSDNNACDILFKLIGGTAATNQYIQKLGIQEMAIVATEEEMAQEWNLQYKNYSSPKAMNQLLNGFFHGKYLLEPSNNFLMKLMTASSNSASRIKALLPKAAVVAHKTGTSDTNKEGLRPALNDVGIITLPNGKHIAVSVFISNDTQKYEDAEKTVAEIAKLIWDYYNH